MAGKGGGAWKVAYADFVTAMMAFFMVMWLVGQNPKVKDAVAEHFQNADSDEQELDEDATGGPLVGHGRFGKKRGEAANIPSPSESPDDPQSRIPRILTLHDNQRTSVGVVLPFDQDSVELNDFSKQILKELLPKLEGKPYKIEVRGHCSGRKLPAGHPQGTSWMLSYSRSLATMRYMEELGISPQRIRLSQAASFEPFTLQENQEKQLRNERVEVYLLNELVTDLQGTRDEREERFQSTNAVSVTNDTDH